jgi:hypothetical protein
MEEPTKMIVPHNQRTCVKYTCVTSESTAPQPPPPPRQAHVVLTRPKAKGLVYHEAPNAPDCLAKKGNNRSGRVLILP